MKLLRIQILVLILYAGAFHCNGQDIEYEQFTTDDGLPSMKIYNILEDSLGVLWMGTENGLVSYDGEEFIRFSHPDLLDNDIIKIIMDQDERIFFINISGQLAYLENDTIQIIELPNISKSLFNINSYKESIFLTFASPKENYYLCESSDGSFSMKESDYYYALHDADEARFLVSYGKDQFISTTDDEFFWDNGNDDRVIFSLDQLYARYNHASIVSFFLYPIDSVFSQYLKKDFYRGLVSVEDDLYLIKKSGIVYYESEKKSIHPLLNGIRINTIFFDSEGTAWVTTSYLGLLKVSNFHQQINKVPNIIQTGINEIVQNEKGDIYLVTASSELIFDPYGENQLIKTLDSNRPAKVFVYGKEIILVDQFNAVIFDENNVERKWFKFSEGMPYLLFIKDDLILFNYSSIIDFSLENSNSIEEMLCEFYEEFYYTRVSDVYWSLESRKLYVGTTKGLEYYEGDRFELVSNKALSSANISTLIEGTKNALWIGTRNDGVYHYRNDSILSHFTIENGLASNTINNLELNSDELLISTNLGLNILNLETKEVIIISTYNYLSSNQVLVCKVIEDDYWIGTIDGLTVLSKHEVHSSKAQGPRLSLKSLFVNGIEQKYIEPMIFDHTANYIQLNFRNISHRSGNDKYIRYRISTIDTSWRVTKDLNVGLPSLKPGRYEVDAMGVNAIGATGNQLNLSFQINPPWWNTLWAKILWTLLLIAIGGTVMLRRVGRIRKEEALKRNYITQINKIKDQALQLQMNPHFIFNSLNAIQGFIGTDEEEKAMNFLARFARLIRLIFEHSKGNTITLEEELEFINLYLDLEKLRFKNRVAVDLLIDEEIKQSKDLIHVPPLLIQPIIENSFKHGLFHKRGVGNLKIDFSIEDDLLKIVVEDDGVGRKMSQKINAKNSEKHVSSGINTTMERLNLLNFNTEDKRNDFSIEDLYHENGEAAGTRINLNLVIDTKR